MQATLPEAAAESVAGAAGKYLTFQVGGEHYGVPVERTREIIRVSTITGVPQMPEHVKGVINLRGRIVPVVDLRIRFGLANSEIHERTCIIVVQVGDRRGASGAMGLMVDAVEEVLTLNAADMEPPPEVVARHDAGHITGMAKAKGTLTTLIDLDRLLAG
ncbi:MAG: chemotaxis protein CheW [Verrucomicrobia bacterium]|nr:chemotaxis protein CheW [Verrucomicrobiota bacterium]